MSTSRTARERARAELITEIKASARTQLAHVGPEGLSLRAVARDLGMVSSALYRYFPNRDALLTALITDAYETIGAAAEQAVHNHTQPWQQWHAGCRAVRDWATANPREYALIYGSPVPGYEAPQDTVPPASRVALALLEPVRRGYTHNALSETATVDNGLGPPLDSPPLGTTLAGQLRELTRQLRTTSPHPAQPLPEPLMARVLIAWTQLFGMVSFELFGHLVGSVDPSDDFFEYAVTQMAWFIGLAPSS